MVQSIIYPYQLDLRGGTICHIYGITQEELDFHSKINIERYKTIISRWREHADKGKKIKLG